jgi:hypothetical protein
MAVEPLTDQASTSGTAPHTVAGAAYDTERSQRPAVSLTRQRAGCR